MTRVKSSLRIHEEDVWCKNDKIKTTLLVSLCCFTPWPCAGVLKVGLT